MVRGERVESPSRRAWSPARRACRCCRVQVAACCCLLRAACVLLHHRVRSGRASMPSSRVRAFEHSSGRLACHGRSTRGGLSANIGPQAEPLATRGRPTRAIAPPHRASARRRRPAILPSSRRRGASALRPDMTRIGARCEKHVGPRERRAEGVSRALAGCAAFARYDRPKMSVRKVRLHCASSSSSSESARMPDVGGVHQDVERPELPDDARTSRQHVPCVTSCGASTIGRGPRRDRTPGALGAARATMPLDIRRRPSAAAPCVNGRTSCPW